MVMEYRRKWILILFTLLGSTYILFHGFDFRDFFGTTLRNPFFYFAMLFSCAVGLLLVFLIYKATMYLDKRYSWRDHPAKRVPWQFALGFVGPALLDLLIVYVYMTSLGQSLNSTGFLVKDYPLVLGFVLLVNSYLLIYNLIVTSKSAEETTDLSARKVIIKGRGTYLVLDAPTEVLYFYRHSLQQKVYAVTENREYVVKFQIEKLEEDYKEWGFLRINRGCLVNLSKVKGYDESRKTGTSRVEFRVPIKDPELGIFDITPKFAADYEAYITQIMPR